MRVYQLVWIRQEVMFFIFVFRLPSIACLLILFCNNTIKSMRDILATVYVDLYAMSMVPIC